MKNLRFNKLVPASFIVLRFFFFLCFLTSVHLFRGCVMSMCAHAHTSACQRTVCRACLSLLICIPVTDLVLRLGGKHLYLLSHLSGLALQLQNEVTSDIKGKQMLQTYSGKSVMNGKYCWVKNALNPCLLNITAYTSRLWSSGFHPDSGRSTTHITHSRRSRFKILNSLYHGLSLPHHHLTSHTHKWTINE